jgi:hypothetical protein
VYEVAGHTEIPPSSIGVRLERHGSPKFSVYCTGRFVNGQLAVLEPPRIEQTGSDEERIMILLLECSPELQAFVRAWIEYCYRRYEAADDRP